MTPYIPLLIGTSKYDMISRFTIGRQLFFVEILGKYFISKMKNISLQDDIKTMLDKMEFLHLIYFPFFVSISAYMGSIVPCMGSISLCMGEISSQVNCSKSNRREILHIDITNFLTP